MCGYSLTYLNLNYKETFAERVFTSTALGGYFGCMFCAHGFGAYLGGMLWAYGDLEMTVGGDELHEKGRPLSGWAKLVEWLLPNAEVYEGWEEDEEDEDVDFIDLYESGDEGVNG